MDVGLRFGLVLIMGRLFEQSGLAMGSGLAAGAATLYAAWMEGSLVQLATYMRFFLTLRWMDDRWVLVRKSWSGETKVILEMIMARNFYGDELILEMDKSNHPFGFTCTRKGNDILIKQKDQLGLDLEHGWIERPTRRMVGPTQYENASKQKGVLKGYYYRILDMTNMDEDKLEEQIIRTTAEMLEVGFKENMVREVLRLANEAAWIDMRKARKMLGMDAEKRKMWMVIYDEKERMSNTLEAAENIVARAGLW